MMHTPHDPHVVLAVLLTVFSGLAMVDDRVFHMRAGRLHKTPGARFEHLLHATRAFLMAPILLLVLNTQTAGLALWAGVGIVLVDLVVEAWDVAEETRSRAYMGGLPRGEAVLHAVLVQLRTVGILLAFLVRPSSAWAPAATEGLVAPDWYQALMLVLAVGALGSFAHHIWRLEPPCRLCRLCRAALPR